jgi:hypothetical protein
MRSVTIITAIICATLLLSARVALASEEIYRWVDDNGTVHFGKQAPGNTKAEEVDIQQNQTGIVPSVPVPEPPSSDQQAEPQVSYAQKRRDERAKQREENAEREEITRAACAQRRKIVS